jgi:hypothetical protein
MPTKNYEVLSAAIDGRALSSWKASTAIETGPEIHLDGMAIPPGGSGVFDCRARVTDMVYADRDDKNRASLRFTPTWFDEKFVTGDTDLLLIVKFPPGVHPDDVVWHKDLPQFSEKGALDPDNVAFVAWKKQYRFTGPMMFGCSFPRTVMARVESGTLWTTFWFWWDGSKQAQQVGGAIFLALFSLCFLLITRGTGITVLLICIGACIWVMIESPLLHLCLWPVIPAMGAAWYFAVHRPTPHYLPAVAQVESGAICRGLTAPEAAVLLELPPQRVLGIVLTALLSKGVIRTVQPKPIEDPANEVTPGAGRPESLQVELRGTRPEPNLVAFQGERTVLEPYEVGFLDVLLAPPAEVAQKDFSKPLKNLVSVVAYKLSGFDRDATRAYYRAITARAWAQLGAEADPQKKNDLAARQLSWLSMSDDYERRMEAQPGWFFYPRWYYGPAHSPSRTWFRDFNQAVAPAASRSAQGIAGPAKGVDLSGVDHFTVGTLNQLMESADRGGSGGGGGFGGCACACAGCACACACAGGGR